MATTVGANADAPVQHHSGAIALGAVALLALWLWPLPLLLLAAWAAELKIATTATQAIARRGVDRRTIALIRRVTGVLHLMLLIVGAACAIALPGPMLMAVFVGAVLSIPAIYALYAGARAPRPNRAGSSNGTSADLRRRFTPPQG